MDFDDLVAEREPPPNRRGKSLALLEHHLYEGAVMVAFALHLLRTTAADEVRIHPDGEHGKQFDFAGWLERRGFNKASSMGTTSYGGRYLNPITGHGIIVNPTSGLGDVVAQADNLLIVAECKGGVLNTRHPGQQSRLAKGLHETVGQLLSKPLGGRQVAVVPLTARTSVLAQRLAPRCSQAGIEIALVGSRGEVIEVRPGEPIGSAAV